MTIFALKNGLTNALISLVFVGDWFVEFCGSDRLIAELAKVALVGQRLSLAGLADAALSIFVAAKGMVVEAWLVKILSNDHR